MAVPEIALGQTFAEVARITKKNSQDALPRSGEGTTSNETDGLNADAKVEISSFSSNSLHQFNAQFNSVLKSIRIADQSMETVQSHIGQMHSQVQDYLKTYPPYPPGSEERVAALKTIAGIRQQIERLTLPFDHFAGLLLGQENGRTGEYEVKMSGESAGQTIRSHAIHLGPDGLDIPELAIDASDQEILSFKGHLERASSAISRSRAVMAEDTERLIKKFIE
jgi:hypothetical protein